MKDIFSLTQKEMDEHFEPIVKQAMNDALAKGGYILYRDENCVTDAEFIHEYADGRKELVRIDEKTGDSQFIRAFQ